MTVIFWYFLLVVSELALIPMLHPLWQAFWIEFGNMSSNNLVTIFFAFTVDHHMRCNRYVCIGYVFSFYIYTYISKLYIIN